MGFSLLLALLFAADASPFDAPADALAIANAEPSSRIENPFALVVKIDPAAESELLRPVPRVRVDGDVLTVSPRRMVLLPRCRQWELGEDAWDDEHPLPKQLEVRGYWSLMEYEILRGPSRRDAFLVDPNGDEVLTSWIGPPEVFNRFRELSDLPLALWFHKNTAIDFLGETNWVAIEGCGINAGVGSGTARPGGRFY